MHSCFLLAVKKIKSWGLGSAWLFEHSATWSSHLRRWIHRLGRVTSLSWECHEESSCEVSAGLPSEPLPPGCPGRGPAAAPELCCLFLWGGSWRCPALWRHPLGAGRLPVGASTSTCVLRGPGDEHNPLKSGGNKQLLSEFCNKKCKICSM